MKAALVIMAAGLGSRYGGNKQVDGVGPGGEILMEYSIHDAIRAGFTKIVFIIKDDMVDLMRTLCGDRIAGLTARDGEPVEVCYAVQDYSSLPAFYTVPAGRTKPFGTTHAVLCARPYVQEPFCVINADDYYGVDAYRAIYQELGRLPQQGKATMVGYLLGNRKQTVAQFSFLMVLAPILGETFLELMKGNLGAQAIGSAPLAAGFVAAFVVGCLACKFMIEIVKRGKLVWFALYCAAAGTVSILSYVL